LKGHAPDSVIRVQRIGLGASRRLGRSDLRRRIRFRGGECGKL